MSPRASLRAKRVASLGIVRIVQLGSYGTDRTNERTNNWYTQIDADTSHTNYVRRARQREVL